MAEMISQFGVSLLPLTESHLEMVRQWRNHPEVARYMFSQAPISEQQQQAWFDKVKEDVSQQHYVIDYRGEAIGVINGKSMSGQALSDAELIEVGMYLAPESRYRGTVLAFCPALAFNDYCFKHWHCQRLQAEVLPENSAALRFNQQLGYSEIERLPGKVVLQLTQENFQAASKTLSSIIRF